ncbi:MAG: lipid A-modifier LpxR family protein, partial [Pseudomonadota bacterium]
HLFALGGNAGGFAWDFAPHYGLALGTLSTAANVGGLVKAGWRLPIDFAPARSQPGVPGNGFFRPTATWGWYVFGGVTGRVVARNLFLDEPSALGEEVDRTPLVGDGQLGLAAYWGRARLSYTHVWRSREFREEIGSSKIGALSLTVNF